MPKGVYRNSKNTKRGRFPGSLSLKNGTLEIYHLKYSFSYPVRCWR